MHSVDSRAGCERARAQAVVVALVATHNWRVADTPDTETRHARREGCGVFVELLVHVSTRANSADGDGGRMLPRARHPPNPLIQIPAMIPDTHKCMVLK